jgi:predicted ATPase
MGHVFRAVDTALERQVALKVIAEAGGGTPESRARFKQEALAAAAIEHPHVVPIYEAGEADALLYIAMRLVDGETLAALIARDGPLDLELVTRLAGQLSGALDAAHARGVVHRDVKPSNVLLQRDGDVPHAYLTDFGIARDARREALTATGVVVGTLDYLAPEALRGGQIDARTDIYALGCVLYEALTGSVPFPRDTDTARIAAHLFDEPRPLQDFVAVPAELDAVLRSALAKDAEARPPRAADLAAAVLHAAGRAGSGLAPPAVVARAPDARSGRTNLPAKRGSLFGRDEELAAVCALCRSDIPELVTVTGAGGVGKTSLALAAGHALLDAFDDGVFFVALEHLQSAADVPAAIAAAMSLGDMQDVDPLDQLIRYASEHRLLLILDNFEHLMDAAVDAGRLAAAGSTCLLVTSQTRLRLRFEEVLPLGPLALPEQGGTDLQALEANPSVSLLVANARRVDPSFQLTPRDVGPTAELCASLDGLPLALELAGARLALLDASELLERVSVNLDALGAGARDAPTRQRGLRAALEWTTSQLDSDARRLLDQLAVFAGGFTLPLAEGVADGDVVSQMVQLADVALITRSADKRYAMAPPVRLYALESLRRAGREEDARRRHAETVLSLLRDARRLIFDDVKGWFAAVGSEFANVREALDWAGSSDPAIHAEITALAADYFEGTVYHRDLGPLIDRALTHVSDPAVRARLLIRQSWLDRGDAVTGPLQTAVTAARELGDSAELIEALYGLSNEEAQRSNGAAALAAAEEARAVADRLGDARFAELADLVISQSLGLLDRHEEAGQLLADIRARAPRDGLVSVFATIAAADLALQRRDAEQALAGYCNWLGTYRDQQWRANEALQIDGAAIALARLGRHEEAVTAEAISDLVRDRFAIMHPSAEAFREQALQGAHKAIGAAGRQAARERSRSLGLERGPAWVAERANARTAVSGER